MACALPNGQVVSTPAALGLYEFDPNSALHTTRTIDQLVHAVPFGQCGALSSVDSAMNELISGHYIN